MTLPPSSVISAVRRSHSIWSKGLTLASLKTRSRRNPLRAGFVEREAAAVVAGRRDDRDWADDTTSSRASIMAFPFGLRLAALSSNMVTSYRVRPYLHPMASVFKVAHQ